ncbi:FYN-binding protein 1 isoform X2 [Acanthochromis polyacanthus]|uniref:FYN-binding protein 1 isoform X2 n=1 Tax=Acanthochromis polyacanthus TaxID=80966 RepID=UPI002233E3CF|nr:FYN-binding protein 1 isoform X2 [Acanthochromis polyacanthus]
MDQQDTMDFKTLRAKFQEEELLLKQPKIKPALPEKPKVVPPPQSPPHYLPVGARPSLLTSINQTLEGKSTFGPRVVFKDEKKESKKPLIQTNSKGKDKSEGKLKLGKDKTTKGSKEKLDEISLDQKPKKENGKKLPLFLPIRQKESTAELVPATPPPTVTPPKKKGLLGFKKSSKRESVEAPADPILDTPSVEVPGPPPLIPVPSDFGDSPLEPEISAPSLLLPDNPTLPDLSAAMEVTPPTTIPESPIFTLPPAVIPDIPAPEVPSPVSEIPLEIENLALPASRPVSQNEILPSPPSPSPTTPPSFTILDPLPVVSAPSPSPPEPEVAAEADIEAVNVAAVETPPAPPVNPPSNPPSPKGERPISALSALERAEDMSPGKRTPPGDQRILNALEKARRKTASPLANPTQSYSITPPPEELPPLQTRPALPELPPIDYEAGNALPPKAAQVNGIDHPSSVLEGITEEGSDAIPELLVVPPPPPRKALPDIESLGPAPEKPATPPDVNLKVQATPEFSETDAVVVPEFDDVASDVHSPELPATEWTNDEYLNPDFPDRHNMPEYYSNGIAVTETEIHAEPGVGEELQDNPAPEPSLPISQDSTPVAEGQDDAGNGVYESTDNLYEDISISASKKKGKTDGGKKRKGPPKNPYAEAAQETNQEKSKTGRFGKSDKKAAAEGPDEKELKKKEKQRLEKEKKELKEKHEREKKEQKEREKKENELKKKFKITGQEDAMYNAKVTVTTKGRKNDLPVKSGDMVSIIRTTNCPKGKWLARDSSNNYGYVAVDHVELDIKEMLELGKKAARQSSNNITEPEVTSTGSRASNHYPLSAESFSDDSEEWTADDDELLSPALDTANPLAAMGHTRTLSMPDIGNKDLEINHQHSQSDISAEGSHMQARHEALQKLATFFHSPKPAEPIASSAEPETSPVLVTEEAVNVPEASSTQDMDFESPEMLILPPPDIFADFTVE